MCDVLQEGSSACSLHVMLSEAFQVLSAPTGAGGTSYKWQMFIQSQATNISSTPDL